MLNSVDYPGVAFMSLASPLGVIGHQLAVYPQSLLTRPSKSSHHGGHRATVRMTEELSYDGEIFCNRNLKMNKIVAVGFDMDYTLAEYHPETFETLAYEGAKEKMVSIGYPTELLTGRVYNPHSFVRGLVVDKKRGNILKMDRHKYVKLARHGFRRLSKDERDTLYNPAILNWDSFSEPDFSVLDTLFSLPDAFLFSEAVELKDRCPDKVPQSYEQIYKDVRRSVDLCHRDGYIKQPVADDPGKYIKTDDRLVESIERLRKSGKTTFLLTNSLWDYTNAVMTFLYSQGPQAGRITEKWTDLFDIIITGSAKPKFLADPNVAIYRVDPDNFTLSNTEGVGISTAKDYLAQGKIFQGGNWIHLHDMLEIRSGSEVLYVGDHMFSDILRSKRTLGWRTMLVIPELEDEINMLSSSTDFFLRLQSMREERDGLERQEAELKTLLAELPEASTERVRADEELKRCSNELQGVAIDVRETNEEYHFKFNPSWGQLFKAGYQNSRFAAQVESYACLYTSRVSNIGQVSPERFFRCVSDLCPHDRMKKNAQVNQI